MEYKTLPSYEILINTLRKTLSTAWHINNIHEIGINKWLSNFVGDALCAKGVKREEAINLERQIALFLLCNFIYYNEEEVNHLMKNIFINSFLIKA